MHTSGLRQNASHDQKCQVVKKQKPYTTFTLCLLCAFSYKHAPNPRQVKAPRRCQLRELQASCKDREPAIAAVSKSCKKAAAAAARVSSCKQAASSPRISPAIKKKTQFFLQNYQRENTWSWQRFVKLQVLLPMQHLENKQTKRKTNISVVTYNYKRHKASVTVLSKTL